MRGSSAIEQVVVGHAQQVHAVARAQVVPEVEARVDLQQVPASGALVLLQVHLEDALQRHLRGDLGAERLQLAVLDELDEGTLAGPGGVGAELAPDERVDHVALRVGHAVERPVARIAAGNVLLQGQLLAKARQVGIRRRLGPGGEDQGLRVVEEAAAQDRLVPVDLAGGLHKHRARRIGERLPRERARHRQAAALREVLEAVLHEQCVGDRGIVEEHAEMALEALAMRMDQLEIVVVAVHERHAPPIGEGEALADPHDRVDRGLGVFGRRNQAPAHAVARAEGGLAQVVRGDHHGDAGEAQRARKAHAAQRQHGDLVETMRRKGDLWRHFGGRVGLDPTLITAE